MIFSYNKEDYIVKIVRKKNKNTYIRVRDNIIYVTTSYFCSDRKIEKLLNENREVIEKMIERSILSLKRKELFLVFGKEYEVIYGDFSKNVIVEDDRIMAMDEVELNKWLEQLISSTFYCHLMEWYEVFEEKIPIPSLKIRKMKTRWGVCNTKSNNITLNLELFRYDIECLDYVIVHELSHFLVQNHSKEFWLIVEKYCPNYKEIRKKLKS